MDGMIEKLRSATSVNELVRLGARVKTHAEMLDEESLSTPEIDYELGQSIASVIVALIDSSGSMDPEQRSLVGALARYFVLTEDEASDLGFGGLIDDAAAVRGVCERLGRGDLAARLA